MNWHFKAMCELQLRLGFDYAPESCYYAIPHLSIGCYFCSQFAIMLNHLLKSIIVNN